MTRRRCLRLGTTPHFLICTPAGMLRPADGLCCTTFLLVGNLFDCATLSLTPSRDDLELCYWT